MCKVRLSEGEKARCKSVCSTLPSKQQGEGEYVYILCFIYEQLHWEEEAGDWTTGLEEDFSLYTFRTFWTLLYECTIYPKINKINIKQIKHKPDRSSGLKMHILWEWCVC